MTENSVVEQLNALLSRTHTHGFSMDAADYAAIHQIVFAGDYPGYRPEVIESPNGDGKLDNQKRYAHIALKYLDNYDKPAQRNLLMLYFVESFKQAQVVASALGVPEDFMPDINACALRILDYPSGAIAHPHTDFDLFTLMMYRDKPEHFVYTDSVPDDHIRALNHQVHYGEIQEILGLGQATPHQVTASDESQSSIVFFALPSHEAELPLQNEDGSKVTVGDWLSDRLAASRYDAG